MRHALALVLLTIALPACKSSGGSAMAVDAALNTALAAGVAGARRADGDCYVPCEFGTYCDTKSGTCVAFPCHNTCKEDEACDQSGGVDRCVPASWLQVRAGANGPPPAAPTATPTPSAPSPAPKPEGTPVRDVPTADPAKP